MKIPSWKWTQCGPAAIKPYREMIPYHEIMSYFNLTPEMPLLSGPNGPVIRCSELDRQDMGAIP